MNTAGVSARIHLDALMKITSLLLGELPSQGGTVPLTCVNYRRWRAGKVNLPSRNLFDCEVFADSIE
jgi:hypothetical protein